jgi:DNA-binding transcriptional LysR family regulator
MDTLDALRLYVSIADAGNLTAAARQQSVATSTVTVALQQLEAESGAALITRSTRRLTFTYEGRQFLADARRILAGLWPIFERANARNAREYGVHGDI